MARIDTTVGYDNGGRDPSYNGTRVALNGEAGYPPAGEISRLHSCTITQKMGQGKILQIKRINAQNSEFKAGLNGHMEPVKLTSSGTAYLQVNLKEKTYGFTPTAARSGVKDDADPRTFTSDAKTILQHIQEDFAFVSLSCLQRPASPTAWQF